MIAKQTKLEDKFYTRSGTSHGHSDKHRVQTINTPNPCTTPTKSLTVEQQQQHLRFLFNFFHMLSCLLFGCCRISEPSHFLESDSCYHVWSERLVFHSIPLVASAPWSTVYLGLFEAAGEGVFLSSVVYFSRSPTVPSHN